MRKFCCGSCSCVFTWCLATLLVAWATHGLPSLTARVFRGYWSGPTRVTLHPGRMMESSERQPFVVGVVMVVLSSCLEWVATRATFQHFPRDSIQIDYCWSLFPDRFSNRQKSNWRSVRILCMDTSKFSKESLHLIHDDLVNVSMFWPLCIEFSNDSVEVFPTHGICLHFRSPIGITTGTSGGAFAEIACLYGIDFTGILLGTALNGIPSHQNSLHGNCFRHLAPWSAHASDFSVPEWEDIAFLELEQNQGVFTHERIRK